MFFCLENVCEETQISGNLTIALKWHYEYFLGTVSLAVGTEVHEVPASPSNISAGAESTQYLSKKDPQVPSHKIWHTVPSRNVFSLKLVMIWIDKVAQGLRSGGAALLGNLGAETKLPIACPNRWKGSVWHG